MVAQRAQAQVGEVAGERGVVVLLRADEIDVFEAGLAVDGEVVLVLPEEGGTLAEQEKGDERQDDDGDERVAAEEALDALVQRQPEEAGALLLDVKGPGGVGRRGGRGRHAVVDREWREDGTAKWNTKGEARRTSVKRASATVSRPDCAGVIGAYFTAGTKPTFSTMA